MPDPTFTARRLSSGNGATQRIVLEMPPSFSFRAGQYLSVLHAAGAIPLSIASAPWRLPELHLLYRSTPGIPEAEHMDRLLAGGAELTVSAAAGDVGLAKPLTGPVLLVAGGTGIAQALGLLDDLAAAPPAAPITLLWCANDHREFDLPTGFTGLTAPRLAVERIADPERSARNRGLARLAESARTTAFSGGIVLAGSPSFVYAATDVLTDAGADPALLQSDVFSYAPRP